MMNMSSSPSSWLFSDNARYSTQARLLFTGLSFLIGVLTFLLYLCVWYVCTSRRRRRQRRTGLQLPLPEDSSSGMSEAAIAALPTFFFLLPPPQQQQGDQGTVELECAVCLGQVEPGEKVRRLPKCAHCFHADCVDAWLRARTTCPMCRTPVVAAAKAAVGTPPVPAAAAEEAPPV